MGLICANSPRREFLKWAASSAQKGYLPARRQGGKPNGTQLGRDGETAERQGGTMIRPPSHSLSRPLAIWLAARQTGSESSPRCGGSSHTLMTVDMQVRPRLVFTLDFQQIVNPAYNRDRGPVSVSSIREKWDRQRLARCPYIPTVAAKNQLEFLKSLARVVEKGV
jgi:hypothetical protein